jgi:hypothetical protein
MAIGKEITRFGGKSNLYLFRYYIALGTEY